MEEGDREIQRADPEWRRKILLGAVFSTLLLVGGLSLLAGRFEQIEELARDSANLASRQGLAAARLLLAAMAIGAVVLGGILGRLSWRTLRTARYPPPRTRVINDTPVVRGDKARRYGRGGLMLAAFLIAAGLWVPYRLHQALDRLLQPRLGPTLVSPADLGVE